MTVLMAYAANGDVIATQEEMEALRPDGRPLGKVDFAAHEARGGKLRDIWVVGDAAGSGTWPEHLAGQAYSFRVELDGKRIAALIHKESGHRRERAPIEAAIAEREVHGIRDHSELLGHVNGPIALDDDGRTIEPERLASRLPLIG